MGATLAEHLAGEGHSVTIVDVSGDTLDRLGDQLDVMCLKGNCVSREVLLEAGAKETDVLIAATDSDEINLLCCHIAHRLGLPYTVARVRGTEYVSDLDTLKGDFGISYAIQRNMSVSSLVGPRIGVSFGLGIGAVIIGTIFGILLGIVAALNRNTFWDTFATVLSVIGVSIPSFVFCLLLLILFGVEWPVLPVLYNSSNAFQSSIIPMVALSMGVIANVARFTRSEMIEVMGSEYIQLAEAKGISRRHLIFHHAIRNCLIPVITVLGPIIVGLMTGSMVIEKICAIPGLGSLLVKAIEVRDYNVILAVSFLYSVLYIVVMLIVDVAYGIIDPRIRLGKDEA